MKSVEQNLNCESTKLEVVGTYTLILKKKKVLRLKQSAKLTVRH